MFAKAECLVQLDMKHLLMPDMADHQKNYVRIYMNIYKFLYMKEFFINSLILYLLFFLFDKYLVVIDCVLI